METIKKKMQALKQEKENALDARDAAENEKRAALEREEVAQDEIKELQSKIKTIEAELDQVQDKLTTNETRLAEAEKAQSAAEAEKDDLVRKTQLQDDDITRLTEQKESLSGKLTQVEEQAELHIRATKALETRGMADDDKIAHLEKELLKEKAAADHNKFLYDEVFRKLTVTEQDLERSDERCKDLDCKLVELTEQVSNLQAAHKSAEARYEKASDAEEQLLVRVQELTAEKEALANQEEFTNRSFKTLQVQLESAEDELLQEKERLKGMTDEVERVMQELVEY
ncbi:tropomyosin-like isoform X4 [Acanthaster planci]|uniref:Tropomyosin-like isoform X4 n=1 Tax=Acanthaster planci TaxID=133434 RepID=A0A8B7ZT69_ACAPL|nr:tropomyosin-like isoform X4 [Acanthaster planci]